MVSLVQQPNTNYQSSTTSATNTAFGSAITQGNLIWFVVAAAANVTITPTDGTLVEVGTGYDTFRRVSVFAKIAGAGESLQKTFTISAAAACYTDCAEYSDAAGWGSIASAKINIAFDSTGSANSVTANLTGVASTSLLVAAGYMSNNTSGNQQITSGFSNFHQASATGNPRRIATATKTGASGAQSATYGTVNLATDNRLTSVLAEFLVAAGGPSLTISTDPITGAVSGTTSQSVTATAYRITAGGVSVTRALDGAPYTGAAPTIVSFDRGNLPDLASVSDTGAQALVELMNGAVVVATDSVDLGAIPGTMALVVNNPNTTDLFSIFHPNYCDTTPVNGDQFWFIGDPGVSINASGEVTGSGEFTVQAWDQSTGLRGNIAGYVISDGILTIVRPNMVDVMVTPLITECMING